MVMFVYCLVSVMTGLVGVRPEELGESFIGHVGFRVPVTGSVGSAAGWEGVVP